MMRHLLSARCLNLILAAVVLSSASFAEAGFLLAPGAKWATFSARPEGAEATPNYYGYGGELTLGYSAHQVFDIAVFGSYIPGRRKSPEFGADDVSLVTWGGVLGFRFASSVYLGFKGGQSAYSVQKITDETEISGRYEGLGGGVSIGAISALSKQTFLQTTFDIMHHVLTSTGEVADGESAPKRRFDAVSISVAYVYNGYSSSFVQNKIFKSFLDSITFF
jgi:hypothetical protein